MDPRPADAATLATLSRLLDAALDLDPPERAAWIDRLGPDYEPLKPRLRHLLGQLPWLQETGFLRTLPRIGDGGTAEPAGVGTIVGPYRLVRPLADGGMGTVWVAERIDGLINRPVALKLPRGSWLPAGLAERMARERQILASLTHPNIARLYDAGVSADGQPFLALELIDGQPLDDYCRRTDLDIRSRVALGLQVARAVAYAHATLVVHRDLKPGNVLVSDDGQVHLLDFGIAKMLDDDHRQDTTVTAIAGSAFTLAYASPEQVAGGTIGVATDVYSLGVVLFELLTGERPYAVDATASGSRKALEDAVLDAQVRLASQVAQPPARRRAMRGDLDTILAKALKQRPEQRYATVAALADDLARYLDGRPVLARPDGAAYVLSKFVRRHVVGVAAAAAVVAALVSGAGVAVWQARVARGEQQRAEEVKAFIASIFEEADPYATPGRMPTALELLKQARARIDATFVNRPALQVELLNIVGASLLASQDLDEAERALTDALRIGRDALGPTHPLTLYARAKQVQVLRHRGRTKEMRVALDELLPVLRNARGIAPEDVVATAKQRAHLEIDEGRYAEAERAAQEADAMALRLLGPRHVDSVGTGLVLAMAYLYAKKPDMAMHAAETARERALVVFNGNVKHPGLIEIQSAYARALGDAGHLHRAIEQLTQARDSAAEVIGPQALMVGFFSQNLVGYQLDVGDVDGAVANSERALGVLAANAAPRSYTVAAARRSRGSALLRAGRARDALAALDEAVAGLAQSVGATHDATLTAYMERALARVSLDDSRGAREDLDTVDAALASRAAIDLLRARAHYTRGAVARRLRQFDVAAASQQAAIAALPEGPAGERMRMRAVAELGLSQLALGRTDEARTTLTDARTRFELLETHMTAEQAELTAALSALGPQTPR